MASTIRVPTIFTATDNFTSVVSKMTAGVSNFSKASESAAQRFSRKMKSASNDMALAGTAIVAPLGIAINSAVKFEDKMADVAKTTGLTTEESDKYGKSILELSKKTRTSISQLQDIGVVAGTIGVAKNELEAFTKAGNEFAIALGSDFGSTEEAVTQVAKLKNLFKETRGIDIATSMTKAGSAINEVSNMAGSADNINEFMLRIGALPDAMKPTIQQSAALGGFLEDAGLSAEIAAGGFSNLLLVAGKNMSGFAKQMGMTVQSANQLYQTDPTQFALKFSKSLKKLKPRELALTLDELKVGSQESIKVVGALSSGYDKLNGSTKIVNGKLVEQKGLLQVSNQAFSEGSSIALEAAKKNGTLAGKLEIAKNNMENLSITIGTQLAPAITKLIEEVQPIIEKFTKWISDNPELTKTIAALGLGLFLLSGVMRAVATAIDIATFAQWLLNIAMTANPIGAIIAAIVLMIAWIALVINKWDEWGAAVALFSGPIGWTISLFQSFKRNWDMIVQAFKTDGIIGGLKAIGKTILDALLMPVQQLLELISKLPGVGDIAKGAAEKIKALRLEMGTLEAPETKQAKATANATLNGQVNVNVSAKNGVTADTQTKSNGGIPIRTTSTQGAF